jgi:hypothetical protein
VEVLLGSDEIERCRLAQLLWEVVFSSSKSDIFQVDIIPAVLFRVRLVHDHLGIGGCGGREASLREAVCGS